MPVYFIGIAKELLLKRETFRGSNEIGKYVVVLRSDSFGYDY